mmetsp:Transcript_41204/g.96947  ORF Transcript_41204/g.96947 Transcript_41204/m.96947 type:complete len:83 (+) Transcript_41204:104-352(+)
MTLTAVNNNAGIALPMGVKIPPQFVEMAEINRRAGLSGATIDRVLKSEANKQGLPVTWTLNDVYNTFCRDGVEANKLDWKIS